MGQVLIDEKGNKYGSLTVIELTKDKNGRTAQLCQCDCGNTKIARGSDLRNNKITHCSKSCPCKVNGRFIDETNNQYGFLTVLYKSDIKTSNGKIKQHCKCECGNECDILGDSLRDGSTKSCGCKSKELNALNHTKDLANEQYGYLIPLEIVQKNSEGNIWRCKCTCGCNREDILVSAHRIISGNTRSCGKLRQSVGEKEIINFLEAKNIQYQKEYSFKDLISPTSDKKLRFDFAIFKNDILNCLIEFDGSQHYKSVEFFGGQEEFEKRQIRDNLKNEYCKNNNIILYRIKYNDNIVQKLSQILQERNI